MMPAPVRIDVRRAIKALLLTLVLPLTAAVLIDLTTGLLPVLTIVGVVVCIPLATIVVNRTVLAEFDRVVKIVAPELPPASADDQAVDCAVHEALSAEAERGNRLTGATR